MRSHRIIKNLTSPCVDKDLVKLPDTYSDVVDLFEHAYKAVSLVIHQHHSKELPTKHDSLRKATYTRALLNEYIDLYRIS